MTEDRGERLERHLVIDDAFKRGDLDALQAALGQHPDFPNCRMPHALAVGDWPLEYALYWSPLSFVEALLALGADPNYPDHAGFPSLLAALASDRDDRLDCVALLVTHGADIDQRGHNDWTPLHFAVAGNDLPAVRLLLEAGADPALRTRIDDCTTPLEDAEAAGYADIAALLREAAS